MRKFIIERELPAVGSMEREQLKGAAAKSNEALVQLAFAKAMKARGREG